MEAIFSMDGPVMKAMRDLTNLVLLNVITLIFCIPVITVGASISAMHYVLYQMVDQKEGKIVRTFWTQFKGNLRSATSIWLIVLIAGGLIGLEYMSFRSASGIGRTALILIYAAGLILAMLAVWLFPLTAKFVYTVRGCFHNAFILAATKVPATLLMVIIMAVIPYVLTHVTALLPLAFLLGLSLPSYFCALLYHPVFEKMIEAQENKRE